MGKNKILIAIVLGLLAFSTATEPIGFYSLSVQIPIQFPESQFEIGYGPTSLIPTTTSVPVFAYNDSMWVKSSYNETLRVILTYENSSFSQVQAAFTFINPNTITLLYTFSGIIGSSWRLFVSGQNVSFSVPITYIAPGSISKPSGTSSAFFSGNQLAINFTYSELSSYNAQVCFKGSNLSSAVVIPFPSSLGNGQIDISVNAGVASLVSQGVTRSFNFWFELDYIYSYAQLNSTGLVSTQIETSKMSPFLVDSNITTGILIQSNAAMRPGRYSLRAFFDDSGNVSIFQTKILILNDASWLWLGGCYPSAENSLASFTSLTSISESPSARPQTVFLMYEIDGVDFYSTFSLSLPLAEVAFTTFPYNKAFSNIGVSLVKNQVITSSQFVNGTMYLMSSQFPVIVKFNITFAGKTFATFNTTVIQGTVPSVNIPLSQITVNVTNNGHGLSGVVVTLNREPSGSLNLTTNSQGIIVVHVPGGSYDFSATYLGVTLSKNMSIVVGANGTVLFPFSISQANQNPPDYSVLLIIILVIGALANVWIWLSFVRRRKGYFRN